MSKKVIIISLASIIVIAGVVVGALVLFKPQTKAPVVAKFDNTPKIPVKTVPDLSKDYGACTILSKEFIKTTLGKPAANLQGPDNMGYAHAGQNVESQTCVYSFITGGTIDNGFNESNGLSVQVSVYKDQSSATTAKTGLTTGATAIDGIGDSAVINTYTDTVTKITSYVLTVFSGLKSYSFTLSQPSAGLSFTADTAKTALTALAQSVTY